MTFQMVTGKRSDQLMYVQSHYVYKKDTVKKGCQYVQCDAMFCPATGVIRPNATSISITRDHNHDPSREDEEVCLYRHSIREKAKENNCRGFRGVFDRQSARYPIGSLSRSFPQDEQMMRRSRAVSVPPPPRDMDHLHDLLNFEPQWRNFALGVNTVKEFFVETVHVENQWNSRVAVMVSPYLSHLLKWENVQLAMDATFDARPLHPASEQLLTLHAFETIDDKRYCWPCAYFLMEKKDQASYVACLNSVNGHVGGNMKPLTLMADFEKAVHNAAKEYFPSIETSGCWFHFCNALWDHVRHLRLVDTVNNNIDAEKAVQKCMALPLLPPGEISNGLALVEEDVDDAGLRHVMHPFLRYINDFWLDDSKVGADTLSVFELDARRNNAVERSHFDLFNINGIVRPAFWNSYESMRRFDYSQHQDRQRVLSNIPIRRKRRRVYDVQDDNIRSMQESLVAGTLDVKGFLSRACHTVGGLQKRLSKASRNRGLPDPIEHEDNV